MTALFGSGGIRYRTDKIKVIGNECRRKIGVARWHEHLCVAVYVGVGVLRFNEVAVGMAHRVLRDDLSE